MHSAGIDIVSNSEDVSTAGPVHHAVGKAHDGAPSLVRRGRSVDGMEQDQQEALCMVVCPQPMLEEGLAKDWVCHQAGAGEEEVLCLSYHGQGDTAGEMTLTGGRWLWCTLLISLMWATLSCFR